jgi:hypothetical protein
VVEDKTHRTTKEVVLPKSLTSAKPYGLVSQKAHIPGAFLPSSAPWTEHNQSTGTMLVCRTRSYQPRSALTADSKAKGRGGKQKCRNRE